MVSELGGAAAFSGLQTRGLPGYRGRLTPEQVRATTHADGSFHTPRTSVVALENTHNTRRRHGLAARRAARPSSRPRESSRSACISTVRGFSTRRSRSACRARRARGPVRHRDALSLERARLPARRADRRVGRADAPCAASRSIASAGRCGRPGSSRPPGCTRSTTTSSASPTTTLVRAGSPRAGPRAGLPVDLELVETNFVQLDVGSLGLGEWEAVGRAARRRASSSRER